MKYFFITGTDTDCGKTYATGQLLDYCQSSSIKALGIKPVASGCLEEQGELVSEDVRYLEQHNPPFSAPINAWKFACPISPHLAAAKVNCRLASQDIADFCFSPVFSQQNCLFIEGAGGIMAPLNEQETWLDFVLLTQIPVMLIVGMRLGCLNHALLTSTIISKLKIPCAGWIANCIDPYMLALTENIDTLKNRMPHPYLGFISYQSQLNPTPLLQKILLV